MKLFSFKKKKPSNIKAEEAKQKRRSSETKKEKFFGDKKEKEPKSEAKTLAQPASAVSQKTAHVLLRPRVTEKATDIATGANGYAFDVAPSATKTEIKGAVKEVYGVDALKVRIVKIPRKRVRSRKGERGVKRGGKKAYLYLKRGDSIEFV